MTEEYAWKLISTQPIKINAEIQERRRGDFHICWLNEDSFILTNRFDANVQVFLALSMLSITNRSFFTGIGYTQALFRANNPNPFSTTPLLSTTLLVYKKTMT